MNTREITSAMRNCPGFLGVCARDKLKNIKLNRLPAAIIINTDRSDQPGKHWVAVYIDRIGNVEYFDSYGQSPLREVYSKFRARKIARVITTPIQAAGSVVCGQYCIFFCHMRLHRRLPISTITQLLRKYNSFVTDNMINEYIRAHFRISTTAYDPSIINQICSAFKI